MGKWWKMGIAVVGGVGIAREVSKHYGLLEKEEALRVLGDLSDRLGMWAIPSYVLLHTITLALCLPYAVFFEAAASMLFGFFPAVLCVFSAKILAASLSFSIGRQVPLVIFLSYKIYFCEDSTSILYSSSGSKPLTNYKLCIVYILLFYQLLV